MVLRSDWLTKARKSPNLSGLWRNSLGMPWSSIAKPPGSTARWLHSAPLLETKSSFRRSPSSPLPFEAIQTNVIGAKNVIYAAIIASSGLPESALTGLRGLLCEKKLYRALASE